MNIFEYAIFKKMFGGGGSNAKFKSLVDGSITNVTAEDLQGVQRVGYYAFAGTNLTSIVVPDSAILIQDQACAYCSKLKSVHLGSGVTKIGVYAFANCSVLTEFTCEATTPPTLTANAFNGVLNNCLIYVPEESVDAYKKATNWAARAEHIFPIGASIIAFTFDGFSGIAEKGMTWADWVGSSHNMYAGMIAGNYVSLMDKTLVLTTDGATAYVTKDQEIIGGINYTLVANPNAVNFTIGQYPYIILESKTFQQLIDENYYGGEFYAEDGYVGSYAVGGLLYKDGNKVPVTYQIQNGDTFTVSA